jgi:hypothetical protein
MMVIQSHDKGETQMAKIQAAGSGSKFSYSLIEPDTYEARITRFIMVGVQPQPAYQGQAKPDSLQAKLAFELVGETVTVTNSDDGSEEQRPAVVFNDINIPAAGITRGKAFDLINAAIGAGETFDDTEKYKDVMNAGVSVTVGTYKNKKTGNDVNCVNAVGALGKRSKEKLEDSTMDVLFFDCYEDSEAMKEVYASLGKFIQGKIKDAADAQFIPAIKDAWPTEVADDGADDKEF